MRLAWQLRVWKHMRRPIGCRTCRAFSSTVILAVVGGVLLQIGSIILYSILPRHMGTASVIVLSDAGLPGKQLIFCFTSWFSTAHSLGWFPADVLPPETVRHEYSSLSQLTADNPRSEMMKFSGHLVAPFATPVIQHEESLGWPWRCAVWHQDGNGRLLSGIRVIAVHRQYVEPWAPTGQVETITRADGGVFPTHFYLLPLLANVLLGTAALACPIGLLLGSARSWRRVAPIP